MSYIINRWNGDQQSIVQDGTIDQSLDIQLVGKNYAGYGEIQNETFLHLLENFSRETEYNYSNRYPNNRKNSKQF